LWNILLENVNKTTFRALLLAALSLRQLQKRLN